MDHIYTNVCVCVCERERERERERGEFKYKSSDAYIICMHAYYGMFAYNIIIQMPIQLPTMASI